MLRFIVAAAITITGILVTTPASAFHHHARWGGCGYGGCGYGYGGCGYGGCGYGYAGYGYGGYGYGMAPYAWGYRGYPVAGYRGYGPVVTPMYYQPSFVPVAPYGYVVNPTNSMGRPAAGNAPAAVQGTPNGSAPARAVMPAATNASANASTTTEIRPVTQLTASAPR